MRLCWTHGLYDAIINIHNRGMKDYIGPLCELLAMLLAAMDAGLPLSGAYYAEKKTVDITSIFPMVLLV